MHAPIEQCAPVYRFAQNSVVDFFGVDLSFLLKGAGGHFKKLKQ